MALLLPWLLALLTMLQICLLCVSGRKLSTKEKNAVLDRHNYYRKLQKASNMRMVEWNNVLEKYADKWVNQCQKGHSPLQKRMGLTGEYYANENLWVGRPGKYNLTQMVATWYNEIKHYDLDKFKCNATCYYYTQMVWSKTFKLGCAVTGDSQCKKKVIFMCLYAPGGNFKGRTPFWRGRPCSGCKGQWNNSCIDGLCSKKNQSQPGKEEREEEEETKRRKHQAKPKPPGTTTVKPGPTETPKLKPGPPETPKGDSGRKLSNEEKKAIVDAHNYFRKLQKASNMRAMVWNINLEKFAESWVNKCANYSSPLAERRNLAGELFAGDNLWIGTPRKDNYTQMVGYWYDEIQNYDYNTLKCNGTCRHYTQVVWAESYKLGCATTRGSKCPKGVLFYCLYAPGGNYRGRKPFLRGRPCSGCEGGWAFSCTEGLCGRSGRRTGFHRASKSGAEKTTANVVFAVILLAATSDL